MTVFVLVSSSHGGQEQHLPCRVVLKIQRLLHGELSTITGHRKCFIALIMSSVRGVGSAAGDMQAIIIGLGSLQHCHGVDFATTQARQLTRPSHHGKGPEQECEVYWSVKPITGQILQKAHMAASVFP